MPLLVTPKRLSQQAELYHQFGQMTDAGLPLLKTIETLHRSPPARMFRPGLERMLTHIRQGSTFTEAVRNVGLGMPAFDVALLEAGEKSGRLSETFRLLARYYEERASLLRDVLSQLAYPIFLLHFAVFLAPFPALFLTGDVAAYVSQVGMVLGPLYLITFLLLYATQSRHGESWRSIIESLARPVPVLGTAREALSLARLTSALEALINAGVNIIEAWELAAGASGSPALRRAVQRWHGRLLNGESPGDLVRVTKQFPELFANLYYTGEISGRLDDTLGRLHRMYQDIATRKLRALAQWLPKIVYLVIALSIAYRIISFYLGYFGQLNQVLGG
jgi:type IV pilus assembly protein PilC